MTTEQQALRDALDEVQNPFGRPTPAQEKLVLAAAEKWAEALSTPPAGDVREALAEIIADGQAHPSFPRPAHVAPFERDFRVADAILADPRFEVRPRGTVTDAEVKAAGRHLGMDDGLEHWIDRESVRTALEAARAVQS